MENANIGKSGNMKEQREIAFRSNSPISILVSDQDFSVSEKPLMQPEQDYQKFPSIEINSPCDNDQQSGQQAHLYTNSSNQTLVTPIKIKAKIKRVKRDSKPLYEIPKIPINLKVREIQSPIQIRCSNLLQNQTKENAPSQIRITQKHNEAYKNDLLNSQTNNYSLQEVNKKYRSENTKGIIKKIQAKATFIFSQKKKEFNDMKELQQVDQSEIFENFFKKEGQNWIESYLENEKEFVKEFESVMLNKESEASKSRLVKYFLLHISKLIKISNEHDTKSKNQTYQSKSKKDIMIQALIDIIKMDSNDEKQSKLFFRDFLQLKQFIGFEQFTYHAPSKSISEQKSSFIGHPQFEAYVRTSGHYI